MKKFPKIIFIGSDNFSLFFLKSIYIKNFNVIGVITNPDNFTKKKSFSSIKKYVIENNIRLLQPENLKDNNLLKKIIEWNPDIQIVVSFKILPKKIWQFPKFGTLNLHPSLLPQYKGPAPINWTIINGEKESGITIFYINNQIDNGNIIMQKKIKIDKDDTAGTLKEKIKIIGSNMLINVLGDISKKNKKIYFSFKKKINNIPLKYAPKIFTEDRKIHWNLSIDKIHNKIRGLSPYPTAWTFLYFDKKKLLRFKIFLSKKKKIIQTNPLGLIIFSKNEMKISVKEGFILVLNGQIEGKKRMDVKDIINGIKKRKNLFVK